MKPSKMFCLAQTIGAALLVIFALFQIVRNIILRSDGFIVACFVAMAYVAYYMAFVPSVKEYKSYKTKKNK